MSEKERLAQTINKMERTISSESYKQYINIVNSFMHDEGFREKILVIDEELRQAKTLKEQTSQFSLKTLFIFYKDTKEGELNE